MKIVVIVIAAVLLSSCSDSSSQLEVITLVAVDEVLLVDPETVAGRSILGVGRLPAGKSLPVSACRPRKSDIDVLVEVDGKPAVAWQGKYKLNRRAADRKKDAPGTATKSCWGLLT
jgi:hypothetical protein